MRRVVLFVVWCLASCCLPSASQAWSSEPVRLVEDPQVSPDGRSLLFVHRGDIWHVSVRGGQARRLTFHPATESQPRFSPDGQSIAFVSDRTGSRQVFIMGLDGAAPRQVTWHTEGFSQDGELVVDYRRANFKIKRGH